MANLQDYSLLLRAAARANELGFRVNLYFWGGTGIGKSDVFAQTCKTMGYEFVDIRLAHKEACDVQGMPYIKDGRTAFAPLDWWPKPGTKGILLFDERNRATRETRNAAFTLEWDRKIDQHQLPPGWFPVSISNPANGDYQVHELDPAEWARYLHFRISGSMHEFLDWGAKVNGNGKPHLDKDLLRFAEAHANALMGKEDDVPQDVQWRPRTFAMFAGLRHALQDMLARGEVTQEQFDRLEFEAATGAMGEKLAHTYVQFLRSKEKPVDAKAVLDKYDAKTRDVVRAYADPEKPRLDLLTSTINDLIPMTTGAKSKLTDKQVRNLLDFLRDVPKITAAAYLKKATQDDTFIARLNADAFRDTFMRLIDDIKDVPESQLAAAAVEA